jgi:hypothetical protein
MRPSRNATEYHADVLQYGTRSYTKTIFHGFIYRFLVELLREDDTGLPRRFPDLDAYDLAHLSMYSDDPQVSQRVSRHFTFSHLQDLVDVPLPKTGQGHVLFLCGHMPGSWICAVGAKYGIGPEFFRQHVHLWRASEGAVLHAVPRLPSITSGSGLVLRICTQGYSSRSLGSRSLTGRLQLLPQMMESNPARLAAAPGSSYVRGHAYISDHQFILEQDISITVESDGEGWTG